MASGQPPGTDPLKPWNEPAPAQNRNPQPPQMANLTDEERQIMKECDRDSFYQRALPLSMGAMVGAHMLVRSGRWAPHPKLGSLPKAIIFGSLGYFMGKISYLPVCQQKILDRIPNSSLAAAIRKSKGMSEADPQAAPWEGSSSTATEGPSKYKEDYSALDGLDDRFRPSVDRDVKTPRSAPDEKPGITYEELRRRNRQEYEDQMAKRPPRPPGSPSYKDNPYMPQKPWPDSGTKSKPDNDVESPSPPAKKKTNMWGDPIE